MRSSHRACACRGMRGLSRAAVPASLALQTSSSMAGVVTATAVLTLWASPRHGGGWRDAVSALAAVEQAKCDKHSEVCASHGFDFTPFGFSVFGSFGPAAQELLGRVCRRYRTHARIAEWEAHSRVHRRLSFAVMRGVADQFVGRRLDSFGW